MKVRVDSAELKKATEGLQEHTENLDRALQKMQLKLDENADAFGGDMLGMLIGMTHDALSGIGMEKLGEIAGHTRDDASAIKDHVDRLEAKREEQINLIHAIGSNGPTARH